MTNFALMKLIIDAGSTKMEWMVLDDKRFAARFTTKGFNPNYSDRQVLVETCRVASLPNPIQSIYYYGTGCGNEQNCLMIKDVLQQRFPKAEVTVTHDLMAACHALMGHDKGIACILGTGSNACVYDGEQITERAVSLGYLVGDEGSGMHIGREVVRAYFYGFMPEDLRQRFEAAYHLELKDFIHHLYHVEQPSKYLASFAKFAGEHQNEPFMHDLVKGCFNAFVNATVLRFEGCKGMTVNFIGSVAYHFRDVLKESLREAGMTLGAVMETPAEGLMVYHQ
jgi:N-acetylglucosamine kinase-like BadF-type ATPase